MRFCCLFLPVFLLNAIVAAQSGTERTSSGLERLATALQNLPLDDQHYMDNAADVDFCKKFLPGINLNRVAVFQFKKVGGGHVDKLTAIFPKTGPILFMTHLYQDGAYTFMVSIDGDLQKVIFQASRDSQRKTVAITEEIRQRYERVKDFWLSMEPEIRKAAR